MDETSPIIRDLLFPWNLKFGKQVTFISDNHLALSYIGTDLVMDSSKTDAFKQAVDHAHEIFDWRKNQIYVKMAKEAGG